MIEDSDGLNQEDRTRSLIRKGMSWVSFGGIALATVLILMFEEKYVGDVTGVEKWLSIVLIISITSCRVFVVMILFGLLITPYCFRKEIKLAAIGATLAVIGCCFLSLFFGHEYPEAALNILGLMSLVFLLNERLHGILKEKVKEMFKEKKV